MKDPLLEFEELDKRLDEVLGNLFKKIGSSFSKKAPQAMPTGLDVKTTTDYFGMPSKEYVYKGSQLGQSVSDTIAKYKKEREIKNKCKELGSEGQNGLFELQKNGTSATFGEAKNFVKDIRGLEISIDELVCYDLSKDKFGVAWLFADSAKFEAKRIWGKPGTIYFDGIWRAGEFKGIMTSHSKLEGGTIVPPGKIQYAGQKKQVPQTGVFKLPVSNLGFTIPTGSGKDAKILAIKVRIDDPDDLKPFQVINNDFTNNLFLSKVSILRKLVQNGIADGYGNFPALQYLFGGNKGENYKNLTEKQSALMKYFSDLKTVVVDNMESAEAREKFISWLKEQISGKTTQVAGKQAVVAKQPVKKTISAKKTLKEMVSDFLKTA